MFFLYLFFFFNFVTVIVSAAAETSTAKKTETTKTVENTPRPTSGIEDLFKDSPSITPSLASEKPQKDVKNDIMSLFEKVCTNASIDLLKIAFDLICFVLFY